MLTLTINGEDRQFDVPEDMPLLWVLRDVAGLTGTKFGCGVALCGACTIHLDGQPIRSCVMAAGAAVGRKITTIEAIGESAGRRKDPASLARSRGGAVRLLPIGADHVGGGAAGGEPEPFRCGYRRCNER